MLIIKPSFEIEEIDGIKMLKSIEKYGRICYKSEDKITEESSRKFIESIIKNGHHSVLEHEKITVKIICDRGVTHEIVRHRIASYSQESTRYCNYSKEKFGKQISVIQPFFFNQDEKTIDVNLPYFNHERGEPIAENKVSFKLNKFDVWFASMLSSEWFYLKLLEMGASPQEARTVLPNSLKTEIIVTYNLREWRHFFNLRTSKKAHPQMREVTLPLLIKMRKLLPVVFDDVGDITVLVPCVP
jgi:thymidylate synthase (FAD)